MTAAPTTARQRVWRDLRQRPRWQQLLIVLFAGSILLSPLRSLAKNEPAAIFRNPIVQTMLHSRSRWNMFTRYPRSFNTAYATLSGGETLPAWKLSRLPGPGWKQIQTLNQFSAKFNRNFARFFCRLYPDVVNLRVDHWQLTDTTEAPFRKVAVSNFHCRSLTLNRQELGS